MKNLIVLIIVVLPQIIFAQVWSEGKSELHISNKFKQCECDEGMFTVYDSTGIFVNQGIFLRDSMDIVLPVSYGMTYYTIIEFFKKDGTTIKYRWKEDIIKKK